MFFFFRNTERCCNCRLNYFAIVTNVERLDQTIVVRPFFIQHHDVRFRDAQFVLQYFYSRFGGVELPLRRLQRHFRLSEFLRGIFDLLTSFLLGGSEIGQILTIFIVKNNIACKYIRVCQFK